MHAYLIVGSDPERLKAETESISKKLKAKIFEFPMAKIEDVRTLQSFTKLAVSSPTAILINSIEEATDEAANAFLKNLEEPQENLYYLLTARSVENVLPTIVSRCQIINIKHQKSDVKSKEAEKFLMMNLPEKLLYIDGIKKREEAEKFLENFIATCHQKLHDRDANYQELSRYLSSAILTLAALRANGNVTLQMTNFVIHLH